MTLAEDINTLFLRNLESLRSEILAYTSTHQIWKDIPGVTNSGGTLALHLAGNLRHFIGSVIGKSGFVRDRESEFSIRNLDAGELINEIDKCKVELVDALEKLTMTDFDKKYPLALGKIEGTTLQILLILISHFNYHLGQINYHRRISMESK